MPKPCARLVMVFLNARVFSCFSGFVLKLRALEVPMQLRVNTFIFL